MTQRETFKKVMQKKGFDVSDFQGQPFMGSLELAPHHRKTREGTHNIINGIRFVMFKGSDTKEGDLGCVTFYYKGIEREKHHKRVVESEILKKAWCPKSAQEASDGFEAWSLATNETINSWDIIL